MAVELVVCGRAVKVAEVEAEAAAGVVRDAYDRRAARQRVEEAAWRRSWRGRVELVDLRMLLGFMLGGWGGEGRWEVWKGRSGRPGKPTRPAVLYKSE